MRHNRHLGTALALASLVGLTTTACFGPVGNSAGGGGQSVVFSNTGGALAEVFKQNAYAELSAKGITVSEESPNNEAKLTAMVQGGKPTWDVFYSTPYTAMGKCGTLFEKIDYTKIDTTGLDKAQLSDCGVPVLNSYFVLVYNKDKYGANPPTSWADFYDPVKFPGTRGIMNSPKDAGMETALLASGTPGDQLYPLDYDKAFATLDKIRPNVRFYDTGAQQTQGLQSGEIDMMLAWPGRAYDAAKSGAHLGVVYDKPLKYYDVLTIVKGAQHRDQAYALINALIGAKNQQAIVDRLPYGATNSQIPRSSNPDIDAFVADDAKAKGTIVVRDNDWWAKNLDDATRRWTKWVNG
ncbi:ABC transporter substrate-binding protein [Saccharopolyspora sp. K220]|uniref:ABC transporter substrate-binding protein n=1 Tax=Saccharopolyspora soli TaxID=2926618 RepID=UPI001F595501|nr:ABC transporter substrate-binding protein [Saccharopolyspora soli]MCI2421646.1 ABC transporter substrate-binding protein [Saccharopolyspora soli]